MPFPLQTYNDKMGGVDLFDQFVATYRIRLRSKKWWWPFLGWGLTAAMVNAWILFRRVGNKSTTLLHFQRQIVQQLVSTYGTPPSVGGRPSILRGASWDACAQMVLTTTRFEDHLDTAVAKNMEGVQLWRARNVTFPWIWNAKTHIISNNFCWASWKFCLRYRPLATFVAKREKQALLKAAAFSFSNMQILFLKTLSKKQFSGKIQF